jgi:hypothetical protein
MNNSLPIANCQLAIADFIPVPKESTRVSSLVHISFTPNSAFGNRQLAIVGLET